MPSAQPWQMRTNLALLVAACVLPGALVSAWLVVSDYADKRVSAEREVLSAARAGVASLERDLASIEAGLRVLASSTALEEDDLRTFHAQALHALPHQNITNYVLIGPQGEQRLNTLKPWNAELPSPGGPPSLKQVFSTRQRHLTDLFVGPVTGQPIFALGVPVLREQRVVYALNAGLFPDRIQRVLQAQKMPSDIICAVLDRQGKVVARNRDMARYVGRHAVPDLVKGITTQPEGIIETTTLEGIPVVTAFSRSSTYGWSVAVGIPQATLTQDLKHSLLLLIGATGLVFSLALYLAWRLAVTRVVRPTRHLLNQMAHITQGLTDPAPAHLHRVAEFAALQEGLDTMRQQLLTHDQERDAMLHRLGTVLESINDGFYLLDPDWRFAYVNGRAETLLGQCRQALRGQPHWQVLSDRDGAALRGPFEQAVRSRQALHLDAHLPDLDLWLEMHLYPGEQGLSVYFQDMRAVREARMAQEAQRVAEASSRAKTEFLSRMSHELRTPLNAVLGFAQLLEMDRQDPPTPRQRVMLGHIMTSGQHLLDMISEVLDVSRIESGTLRVHLEPLDLIELLHLCEQMVAADARQAGLMLLLDLPAGPLMVVADRTRLKQVLLNLLSNAIKYNRPGGTVTLKAQQQGPTSVRLSVQDSGLGMTAEQLAHLFEPFNRLGREHSGVPGTGIGLVICQRLIQMMGGALTVSSVEGQGSLFSVDLPSPTQGPDAPDAPST